MFGQILLSKHLARNHPSITWGLSVLLTVSAVLCPVSLGVWTSLEAFNRGILMQQQSEAGPGVLCYPDCSIFYKT